MSNILYLDPSISNFGYCIEQDGEIVNYGHKRTYSKYLLHERVKTIADEINEQIYEYDIDTLVYEYPDKGKYHPTGMQTFVKLGVAIGAVLSLYNWESVFQYTPREWKSNKSKEETELLVKEKYGIESKDSNEIDAIGLCAYHNEKD